MHQFLHKRRIFARLHNADAEIVSKREQLNTDGFVSVILTSVQMHIPDVFFHSTPADISGIADSECVLFERSLNQSTHGMFFAIQGQGLHIRIELQHSVDRIDIC